MTPRWLRSTAAGGAAVAACLWLGAASGKAAPEHETRRWCTDRGGLLAAVGDDGRVSGVLAGRFAVRGSTSALQVVDGDEVLWEGALADLHPFDAPGASAEAVARRFEALVPGLNARGRTVRGLGFKGTVGDDGVLRGTWNDKQHVAYALGLGDRTIFGGRAGEATPVARLPGAIVPLEDADPLTGGRPTPLAAALGRVVEEHLDSIDVVPGCAAGGKDWLGLGAWPRPIAVSGRHVVWATSDQALVRSLDGAAWYETLPMAEDQARSLARELADAWPGRTTGVAWADGRALVLVARGDGWSIDGVAPAEQVGSPLLRFLDVPEAVRADEPVPERGPYTEAPVHDAGLEVVARLNAIRTAAGLDPVAWDDALAWSALGHCTYLAWEARVGLDDGWHREDPSSPVYLGDGPDDRGGAMEVAGRDPERAPWEMVDRWLAAPYHRGPPLDPRAKRAGACALPDGTAVMEIADEQAAPAPLTFTWPPDGASEVPRVFDGREEPQPVPDRSGPFGYTISVSVDRPPSRVEVVGSSIEAHGEPVAHVVLSPATDAVLAGAPRAAVHLLPSQPLDPATRYHWRVRLKIDGDEQELGGTFTTADDPLTDPSDPDGVARDLVTLANAVRVGRGLGPLEPTRLAETAAALVASTGTDEGAAKLLGSSPWTRCLPADEAAKMTIDADRLPPGLLDPKAHWFGYAARGDDVCLLATSDPRARSVGAGE